MFRICSLLLYLHISMGLVLGKVKKLHHPKLTLDLLPVCLTFPFQTSPRQEMRRLCFHTLWSYRFGLTRVRFTQKSSETPGEHCRVSVQLLFERLSWGGVYCSCSKEGIPWTCSSSGFFSGKLKVCFGCCRKQRYSQQRQWWWRGKRCLVSRSGLVWFTGTCCRI